MWLCSVVRVNLSEICGSHDGEHIDYGLLCGNAVWSLRSLSTFQRNVANHLKNHAVSTQKTTIDNFSTVNFEKNLGGKRRLPLVVNNQKHCNLNFFVTCFKGLLII